MTISHGTLTGYQRDRCRCDECKTAMSVYKREYRSGRRRLKERQPTPVPHGTVTGYTSRGCRCDVCRAAMTEQARRYRKSRGVNPLIVRTACGVEGCTERHYAKGWCRLHYYRTKYRRDASPGPVGRIPRNAPGEGCITPEGYRIIAGVLQHRSVMEAHIGRPLLPHENVHHRNGDRADNRIENLELWSSSQPAGQRVVDKIAWAEEILATYADLRQLSLL